MTDLVQGAAGRHGWARYAPYRFEIAIFMLVAITLAAVVFREPLLARTVVIEPRNAANYSYRYFGDEVDKAGTSRVIADAHRPMQWLCRLRPKFAYPFCSYVVVFDRRSPDRGLDLSRFDSVTLDLHYSGPFDTFRVSFKNFDRRYSKPGVQDTLKFNKLEISAVQGRNVVTVKLSEFGVPEWWLTQFHIAPALGKPQFDNITQLEFQTGTGAPPADYRFRIDHIVLRGHIIDEATWYASILIAWAVLIGLYLLRRIVVLRRDLERRHQSQAAALRLAQYAEETARRDNLTKLLNRTGITDLYHSLALRRSSDQSFAAIMVDIDHFKAINDRFGHMLGDDVLKGVAAILGGSVREGDIVGRWGGEEFALICGAIDPDSAMKLAHKLRLAIESHDFPSAGRVTASFGVYCWGGRAEAVEQILSCADLALYAAKDQGRNRAVMYEPFMRKAA